MATGYDANGQDGYATIVAAVSGNSRWRWLSASCERNGDGEYAAVILTWDGGLTEVRIVADRGMQVFRIPKSGGPIEAKNADAGIPYDSLVVNAW